MGIQGCKGRGLQRSRSRWRGYAVGFFRPVWKCGEHGHSGRKSSCLNIGGQYRNLTSRESSLLSLLYESTQFHRLLKELSKNRLSRD
jgi:hypothetical protein